MLSILFYCLTMGWTPSVALDPSLPITYSLYLDGILIQEQIVQLQASVCIRDLDIHTVSVQAVNSIGETSERTDESDPIQMIIQPPLFATPPDPVRQSDLDGDGSVGYGDFGIFSDVWGRVVE